MPTYIVYLEQLPELLAAWRREYAVYAPAAIEGGFFDFKPWKPGAEIAFDFDLAYNTLKRYFLPPREHVVAFDLATAAAEPLVEAPAQLFFGVHPYDIRAINQLDKLMVEGSPDQNYVARREASVIMALEPMRVAPTSFWGSLGADRLAEGFDLYWTKIGPASFHVQVGTDRGEALLKAGGHLTKATKDETNAAEQARQRILALTRANRLLYDWRETPEILAKSWNSPLWRERSASCLSCGSCNLVCPTCYCFDVRDEADERLDKGRRTREWDGCMLKGFALIAGGLNFRGKALERYRHRYMRKGKYIFDKIGELGCVGCGRCVRACTTKIANPKEVFNDLWEASQS